jgi:ABC-type molybdenum transport system ATPase subunit/photorepair protein PhrA
MRRGVLPSVSALGSIRWQSKKKTKTPAANKPAGGSSADSRAGATKGPGSQGGGSGAPTSRNGAGVEGDIIFTVHDLSKTLPGGRVLFSNITLAFQRGAKIGVLGLNGCGKSTLLKILGGT